MLTVTATCVDLNSLNNASYIHTYDGVVLKTLPLTSHRDFKELSKRYSSSLYYVINIEIHTRYSLYRESIFDRSEEGLAYKKKSFRLEEASADNVHGKLGIACGDRSNRSESNDARVL